MVANIGIIAVSLIGFVALTACTAIFVAAEFSLTALEKSSIDEDVARRGDSRSKMVQSAHRTLSLQLSGAQLGITITTLLTGYIAEPVLAMIIRPACTALGISVSAASVIAIVVSMIVATSVSMIWGELVPKNIAISEPLRTARATAGPQIAFTKIFSWFIRALNGSANWIIRRLGMEPVNEAHSARSAQELGAIVRNAARRGSLDAETAALVDRSLRFGSRSAEDFMTPRTKVETLECTDTVDDLIEAAARTGFSRFPVVDGDLDDTVGFVHVKQAFTVPVNHRKQLPLSAIATKPPVVPTSLDGDTVMDFVRSDGLQVALVVDEYGGTSGIVTVEDLIEEIVGDVRDEHDIETADIEPLVDGYRCSGLVRIDELESHLGYRAPEGDYETLGGLMMFYIGRIPAVGDEVELPIRGVEDFDAKDVDVRDDDDHSGDDPINCDVRWIGRVEVMDGRRVDQVKLSRESVSA